MNKPLSILKIERKRIRIAISTLLRVHGIIQVSKGNVRFRNREKFCYLPHRKVYAKSCPQQLFEIPYSELTLRKLSSNLLSFVTVVAAILNLG